MSDELVIESAEGADVPAYLRLRDEAARDMVERGIDQWRPGELTEDALLAWIGDGQLYVARRAGELVGGFFVMWADDFWDGWDGDAGYTHGLLVDRRYKGAGLGRRLLGAAEDRIRAGGRSVSRLDTVRSNQVLRQYYREAGYAEVGERTFETGQVFDGGAPIRAVTLFEKPLA